MAGLRTGVGLVSHNPKRDRCSTGRIGRGNAPAVAEMSRLRPAREASRRSRPTFCPSSLLRARPSRRRRGMPSGWTRAKTGRTRSFGTTAAALRPFVGWTTSGRTIVRLGGAFARHLLA